MLNLNKNIDLDPRAFWRWWRRELDFLVPDSVKRLFHDKQGFVIVTPQEQYLSLSYFKSADDYPERGELIATIERSEAGLAQGKALLANNEVWLKTHFVLRLTAQASIARELVLPLAAKENLHQVVAYELDRYTPFKAEQVYFAVKMLDGAEPGQLRLRLVLTPREILDSLCEDLNTLGVTLLFADSEHSPNFLDRRDSPYNLLPDNARPKTTTTPAMIHAGLMGVVAIMMLMVLALPVWLEYQTVKQLEEKIKLVEKEAKKVKAMQAEIDAVINETQTLINEKNARPMVVDMLNSLSEMIKDDTYLSYLQYSENHLQIHGESPAASALIGILEASEFFTKARFVSPVTQNNVTKLERFQITVDITKSGEAGGNSQN